MTPPPPFLDVVKCAALRKMNQNSKNVSEGRGWKSFDDYRQAPARSSPYTHARSIRAAVHRAEIENASHIAVSKNGPRFPRHPYIM